MVDALFDEWRDRREREGARVDLHDLYALVADARDVAPDDLPIHERQALARRALLVIWPGFEQVAPIRQTEPIRISAYRPEWVQAFVDLRDRLAGALGPVALRIDHIGSTAVPGLAAKPIIDLQVSVADLADEDAYVPGCAEAGFELYTRDDAHRFFDIAPPMARTAHLHVCASGGAFERDHLLFRDFLLAHADERDGYAAMKREAAAKWGDDRLGYTYAKNEYILDLLDRANDWAAAIDWSVAEGA